MTYCLGVLIQDGLVLASDSRTNAGIDQIAMVRKQVSFVLPGERTITVLSAGNLATTQAVVTSLKQSWSEGDETDLTRAPTMFDVATILCSVYRRILDRDGDYVRPFGDVTGSFIIGGQIKGEEPRLFQVYPAGNFIEAGPRTQFLQIGETKYGKPILDRALNFETSIGMTAKLALLSFDATIHSNLSVGPPNDLLPYRRDSYSVENLRKYSATNAEWSRIRDAYSEGLIDLLSRVPDPAIDPP